MVEAIKNAALGIKRMSVIIWCVTAIVTIIFLSYHYGQRPEAVLISPYVIITAMTLIAGLGGIDIYKQAKLFKDTSNG
jgi:hypothetical protein